MVEGSITAAVVFGAIVSLLALIVGRGSKISELRQAWINSQRADLADFGAAALSLASQRSKDRTADFDKLEAAAYRVRLRENPRKREWLPVIERMDVIRAELVANGAKGVDVLPRLIEIGDIAQDRLKKDWNKVRFGEPADRWLLVLLVVLIGVLGWMGYRTLTGGEAESRPSEHHVSGELRLLPPIGTSGGSPAAAVLPTRQPVTARTADRADAAAGAPKGGDNGPR
ncbi:hypothetical protein [Sphingomonas corticis]|uniref:DUF2937 family protein n=1 Tax=Sphingomonas corticis TaxID=2722791 RepID=A0ABX1CRL0_9SPHN|nr:hypothetical protein [Sphingomonas corticis]NJR80595.1 hypothetical protein [Sphingomonas corticis]